MKKRYLLLFAVIVSVTVFTAIGFINRSITADSSAYRTFTNTVILDAGHGGEDGGAVSPDGTVEKDVNLSISNGIAAYFELFGIPYVPVRTDDRSVCDEGLVTIRERKRSDIRNRFTLVNETPNAILLSIHQNFFTVEKYAGTQVFYAPDDAASETLAKSIRASVQKSLQPENKREIKPSTDSVYLLYHAKKPSVMVECGFLSNKAECDRLKEPTYQSQISYYIFKGLLDYLNL